MDGWVDRRTDCGLLIFYLGRWRRHHHHIPPASPDAGADCRHRHRRRRALVDEEPLCDGKGMEEQHQRRDEAGQQGCDGKGRGQLRGNRSSRFNRPANTAATPASGSCCAGHSIHPHIHDESNPVHAIAYPTSDAAAAAAWWWNGETDGAASRK